LALFSIVDGAFRGIPENRLNAAERIMPSTKKSGRNFTQLLQFTRNRVIG